MGPCAPKKGSVAKDLDFLVGIGKRIIVLNYLVCALIQLFSSLQLSAHVTS